METVHLFNRTRIEVLGDPVSVGDGLHRPSSDRNAPHNQHGLHLIGKTERAVVGGVVAGGEKLGEKLVGAAGKTAHTAQKLAGKAEKVAEKGLVEMEKGVAIIEKGLGRTVRNLGIGTIDQARLHLQGLHQQNTPAPIATSRNLLVQNANAPITPTNYFDEKTNIVYYQVIREVGDEGFEDDSYDDIEDLSDSSNGVFLSDRSNSGVDENGGIGTNNNEGEASFASLYKTFVSLPDILATWSARRSNETFYDSLSSMLSRKNGLPDNGSTSASQYSPSGGSTGTAPSVVQSNSPSPGAVISVDKAEKATSPSPSSGSLSTALDYSVAMRRWTRWWRNSLSRSSLIYDGEQNLGAERTDEVNSTFGVTKKGYASG